MDSADKKSVDSNTPTASSSKGKEPDTNAPFLVPRPRDPTDFKFQNLPFELKVEIWKATVAGPPPGVLFVTLHNVELTLERTPGGIFADPFFGKFGDRIKHNFPEPRKLSQYINPRPIPFSDADNCFANQPTKDPSHRSFIADLRKVNREWEEHAVRSIDDVRERDPSVFAEVPLFRPVNRNESSGQFAPSWKIVDRNGQEWERAIKPTFIRPETDLLVLQMGERNLSLAIFDRPYGNAPSQTWADVSAVYPMLKGLKNLAIEFYPFEHALWCPKCNQAMESEPEVVSCGNQVSHWFSHWLFPTTATCQTPEESWELPIHGDDHTNIRYESNWARIWPDHFLLLENFCLIDYSIRLKDGMQPPEDAESFLGYGYRFIVVETHSSCWEFSEPGDQSIPTVLSFAQYLERFVSNRRERLRAQLPDHPLALARVPQFKVLACVKNQS